MLFSVYVTVSNSGEEGKKKSQGGWVKWAWLSASINVRSHDTIIASRWKEPAKRGLFLSLFAWWHQSIINSNSSNSSFQYQIEQTPITYFFRCLKTNLLTEFLQKLQVTYLPTYWGRVISLVGSLENGEKEAASVSAATAQPVPPLLFIGC